MDPWRWASRVSTAYSRPDALALPRHGRSARASAFALALAAALATIPGCRHVPQKKLIEFGWDEPDTACLRRHIGRMEQMPFDGCVFHALLEPDAGAKVNLAWSFWGRRRFERAHARQAREDLWKTPRRRLRHNFLRLNVTPGDVDWYEDFSTILANARLASSLAREGGCAGMLLDTEAYQAPLFDYRRRPAATRRTWSEYAAQARLRGRELMHALEQGFPKLTLLLTFGYALPWRESGAGARSLAECPNGLLAPFLDGLLEGRRGGRIVDGYEMSYGLREAAQFRDAYLTMRASVLPIVGDPERYRTGVSCGFGLWLDYDWRKNGWSRATPERNYFTPEVFEQSLVAALRQTDEYVWIYSETPRWWTPAGSPSALPPAYVEAVRRARQKLGID